MKLHGIVIGLALLSGMAANAQAYDDQQINNMQQELQAMRKEISAGGISQISPSAGASPASLAAQLNDIQDQIRQLKGMIEENQHRQSRVEADMKSLNEDMDYRLRALEEKAGMGAVPGETDQTLTPPPGTPAPPIQPVQTLPPQTNNVQPVPTEAPPAADTTGAGNYSSAKEQYDAAFKLMNQAKYAEAGAVLESFTQRYPKDPLLGNVYYWLGETYYVRENYVKSADNFRQGFETMPDGVKAPDNLLKLALSLNMLNKKRESCVVLKQLQIKYQGSASPVLQKAANKEKDLGCVR